MTVATVEVSADGGSIRISVGGEIDLENAATVEREISAAVPDRPATVSVDLTNLTYMDSVGIRIIFDLASRLQKSGIVLELIASLGSPARQLLDISGINGLATLHPPRN
ncbi:MAG TPA: STAS domain-containing protein [Pseudonocardiaceae bacterium]|nr:STAS domain-containing protein [Pseudonocardiaceae bacterium]